MHELKTFEEFRGYIVETMGKRKVNQKELAEAIGVHQPTISRLLRGKNSPSIDLVLKVCNYLKIKVAVAVPTITITHS